MVIPNLSVPIAPTASAPGGQTVPGGPVTTGESGQQGDGIFAALLAALGAPAPQLGAAQQSVAEPIEPSSETSGETPIAIENPEAEITTSNDAVGLLEALLTAANNGPPVGAAPTNATVSVDSTSSVEQIVTQTAGPIPQSNVPVAQTVTTDAELLPNAPAQVTTNAVPQPETPPVAALPVSDAAAPEQPVNNQPGVATTSAVPVSTTEASQRAQLPQQAATPNSPRPDVAAKVDAGFEQANTPRLHGANDDGPLSLAVNQANSGDGEPSTPSLIRESLAKALETTAPPPNVVNVNPIHAASADPSSANVVDVTRATPAVGIADLGADAPRSSDAPEQTGRPVRATLPEIGDTALRSVRYLARNGEHTMTVRLIPESLGEVRIEVNTAQDITTVRMIAASSVVREALETQAHHLRDALAKEGIDVRTISVTDDGGSSRSAFGQRDANGSHHGDRATSGFGSAMRSAPANQYQPSTMTARTRHEGSLDLVA